MWLKAGIKKDNLLIALEPETASLFCKHLPIEKMVASESGYNVFSSGSTYIVLDAGGKLIFIFLYEHLLTIFIGYLKLKSIWAFPRSYFERIGQPDVLSMQCNFAPTNYEKIIFKNNYNKVHVKSTNEINVSMFLCILIIFETKGWCTQLCLFKR